MKEAYLQQFWRMRFAFLTATSILSVTGVFGTFPTRSTNRLNLLNPQAAVVEKRANNTTRSADAVQYWTCMAVSASTKYLGWAEGGSESSTLSSAERACGQSDCTDYKCVEKGCVAIAYDGFNTIQMAAATGYGQDDREVAGIEAVAICGTFASGCKLSKTYCSQYTI